MYHYWIKSIFIQHLVDWSDDDIFPSNVILPQCKTSAKIQKHIFDMKGLMIQTKSKDYMGMFIYLPRSSCFSLWFFGGDISIDWDMSMYYYLTVIVGVDAWFSVQLIICLYSPQEQPLFTNIIEH